MGPRSWVAIGLVGLCALSLFLAEQSLEHKLKQVYFWTSKGNHYWQQFKNSYISPSPTLQETAFQGDLDENTKDKGQGERVKEAAEKSFEKTKMAVEDSAKSAADKVKKSLSERTKSTDHPQDEL